MSRVIAFPHSPGKGGPGTFQRNFERVLKGLGWQIIYTTSDSKIKPDLVFVVGGTRKLFWLIKMKTMKVPIFYRLDGINWLHRKRGWGTKHYLEGEYRNINNKLIHGFIADFIIYQSQFVKNWWDKESYRKRRDFNIVYNGTNLRSFKPDKNKFERIVFLEGTIDYSPFAIDLINAVRESIPDSIPVELFGAFITPASRKKLDSRVQYKGLVNRRDVPKSLINAIYVSMDVNPACPNTVVEAMACGSPVVAFDTGAINEVVSDNGGIVVPFGANPWKLESPDHRSLIEAIFKIIDNWDFYSKKARSLAAQKFDEEKMVTSYLKIFDDFLTNVN